MLHVYIRIAPPTPPHPAKGVVVKQEVVDSKKDCKEWTVDEVYDHFLCSECAEFANIFKEQVREYLL